jgi:hypothetical protein
MTTKDILRQEFDDIATDLAAKHIELGMKASGRWLDSLEVQVSDDNAKLLANNYTRQLVNGRAGGSFPPIESIKQWIQDKGIQSDIPVSSLAFLIARKIAREGTEYFKQGGTDLVESVITPQRIQRIIDLVGNSLTNNFVDVLVRDLKQAA